MGYNHSAIYNKLEKCIGALKEERTIDNRMLINTGMNTMTKSFINLQQKEVLNSQRNIEIGSTLQNHFNKSYTSRGEAQSKKIIPIKSSFKCSSRAGDDEDTDFVSCINTNSKRNTNENNNIHDKSLKIANQFLNGLKDYTYLIRTNIFMIEEHVPKLELDFEFN